MTNKSTRGKNDLTSFYYIHIYVCVCVCACVCVCVIHENTTIKDGSFNDEGDDFQKSKTNKLYLTRDIELIIKYRVIWIPSVLTVFSLRTFTCDVK